MIVLALYAALFAFLVWKIAPDRIGRIKNRILVIAVGSVLLEAALLQIFHTAWWAVAVVLIVAAVVWVALEKWCGIERRPALKIAGAYTAIRFLVGVLLWTLMQASA